MRWTAPATMYGVDRLYDDPLRRAAVRRCALAHRRWVTTGDRRCLEATLSLASYWGIGTVEMR